MAAMQGRVQHGSAPWLCLPYPLPSPSGSPLSSPNHCHSRLPFHHGAQLRGIFASGHLMRKTLQQICSLPPSHSNRLKNSLCSKGTMPSLSVKTQAGWGILAPSLLQMHSRPNQSVGYICPGYSSAERTSSLHDENQSPFVISQHGSLAQLTIYTVTILIF